ncbi:hypothetical protein G6O69_00360 [Pseudenhygromyxa sp. WMMC2535]|uniref:hypothetical protein n=1 Tax=Pseudenhygromyxa sp. WMMC2535 TaxID=2712867 RepID=UPI001554590A|nr:hypothetical protein [Pseudenhygromyxa sp. WMMC2535]NVB36262.1 hypothetical protein [Pseudenhygromyxa sp. WMMC2535]
MRTRIYTSTLITLSLLSLPLGCAVEDESEEALLERDGEYPELPAEGSELAYGMLRVANELDYDTLDVDVDLDSRSATSIIEYRAGADELIGTADDRFIPSLAVLDGLYWLGPANLWKIQDYASLNGYVPTALPAAACEPELEDAVAECLYFLEDAATPIQSQLQGQYGWAPFKADLLSSCLDASDATYPSADYFTDAGAVGYLDPLLGYQSLMCELSSDPICALGVAGVADLDQPECADLFSAEIELDEAEVDATDRADWDAQIDALESACNGECGYWVRVYEYEAGVAPTLLGDVIDVIIPSSPLDYGYGAGYLTRETSDQLPSVAAGAQALLSDVLADLGLSGEPYEVASAADEVACPNCHHFLDTYVIQLRDAGVIIVLDVETFWDS